MTVRAPKARWTVLLGLAGLLAAGRAYAQTTTCNTDLDCPGTACGSQVCVKSSGGSMCADPNTSHASGIDDGWCADSSGNASDGNCKCHSLGATCNGFYCTFTIPPDGGATGMDASTKTGGGGGGCSVAGTPSALGPAGAAFLLALVIARRRRR